MKLESVIRFFKHVADREGSHGIPHAFRFKAILSSRKKGTMGPAHYKDEVIESGSENQLESIPSPPRRKRRKRVKASGNTAVLNPEILEEGIELPATSGRPEMMTPTSARPVLTTPTLIRTTTNACPVKPSATLPSHSHTNTARPNTTIIATGLHTPGYTPVPHRTTSPSPPLRNRARGKKSRPLRPLTPEGTPASAPSSSEPRRSKRTTVRNAISPLRVQKPNTKGKTPKKKLRR